MSIKSEENLEKIAKKEIVISKKDIEFVRNTIS
jgi:hypothetical protein